MNYIYIQSTVSVSLTTRERGAYTRRGGGRLIFRWSYIQVEKCVTNLGGLIFGGAYTQGAYLRNFTVLKPMLTEVLDILMIPGTKLDDSFLKAQFHMEGFRTPFRLDCNKNGGGILLYVQNNIDAISLTDHVFSNDTEASFTEIKVSTCKWLVFCSHNANRINVSAHLEQIWKALGVYSKKYENVLLMDDYNVDVKKQI